MRDGRGWVLREPAFEKEGERKASARSCSHAVLASNMQSSLEDGLKILKEVADLMKDIAGKLIFEQGEGVHKVLKPTRDAFNMLHLSFERTKSFLSENNLQHIAEDIFFPSFMTLHVEHFFAGMRNPSRPTPDMYDYASRRPSCIIESVQKVSLCTLDHRATTPNERLTKTNLSGFMNVQRSLGKTQLGEKTVRRKRTF